MGSGACHHSLPCVWGQVERLSPSWACRPARLAGSCRLQEGWSLFQATLPCSSLDAKGAVVPKSKESRKRKQMTLTFRQSF